MGGWGTNVGVSILDCEVSSVKGSYTTGIGGGGRQIVLRNNRIYFPTVTDWSRTFQGIHMTGSDCLIEGNMCEGGTVGFYTDTLSMTNITIVNNVFRNSANGVVVTLSQGHSWNLDNVSVLNNKIELNPNMPGSWTAGISFTPADTTGADSYRNIMVAGNTVRYLGGVTNGTQGNLKAIQFSSSTPTTLTNIFNVSVVNNTLERTHSMDFWCKGTYLSGNVDFQGVPLEARTIDSASPNSVSLNPLDRVIQVTKTTATTVALPPAYGFKGKEVVLVNAQATATVTVVAIAGEQILPSSSYNVAPYATARFVADGASKWIKNP